MKVLHAYKIYMPEVYGGIPQVISMMSKIPAAASSVLTARFAGLGRNYSFEGIPVHATSTIRTLFSMPLAPFYPFIFWWRAIRSDVVVHHAPFPLTDLAISIAFPSRTRLVVFWHAEVLGKQLLMKLFSRSVRKTLERADTIIVSDTANIENSQYLKPYADKCEVLPFGCDIEYWSKLSEAEAAKVAATKLKHPKLVVTTGRLVGYKGHDVLLRAMYRIEAHTVIIGEGPMRAELESIISDSGIGHKVTLAGALSRDDLKIYLHAADVFALPSVSEAEAFGIAQIEAMAAGCPIVNTRLKSAVPLIARNDIEGLSVEPNRPIDLRDAIWRILNNPAEAKRFSDAAVARARSDYSQDDFMRKSSDLLTRKRPLGM